MFALHSNKSKQLQWKEWNSLFKVLWLSYYDVMSVTTDNFLQMEGGYLVSDLEQAWTAPGLNVFIVEKSSQQM